MTEPNPRYDSRVGLWIDYASIGGYGRLAETEVRFSENHEFVWRELRFNEHDEPCLTTIWGRWRLAEEILYLEFTATEEPETIPNRCRHLRIIDRLGRIALETIRIDDEDQSQGGCGYFLQPAQPGDAERSFELAMQARKPPTDLAKPFRLLEPMLTVAIPLAVRRLSVPDPIFCIRLYYHNTLAPRESYCTWVRVLTEPARRRVIARHRPIDVEYHLWNPTAGEANGTPSRDPGLYEADLGGSREIASLYGEVYDLLCESEDEFMRQLREMLCRVSRALNNRDWSKLAQVTDDFVVFPADGSNHFGGEYKDDMQQSIPASKLELLRERGYLPQ